MCYSLLGIVFCVGITAYQANNTQELLRLFPLSLCALFICAFISLYLMRRFVGKLTTVIVAILWFSIAFIPLAIFRDKWEQLLSGLPVAITISIAVLSCALFLLEIKKLLETKKTEAAYYAIG
jgi:hypothetical protein